MLIASRYLPVWRQLLKVTCMICTEWNLFLHTSSDSEHQLSYFAWKLQLIGKHPFSSEAVKINH
jgi:hypothetical protein